MSWFRRLWERSLIRAEAFDWVMSEAISEQTFIAMMLSLRKEAKKWR